MPASEQLASLREAARLFEANLPRAQRKRLGQFFTGLSLGRLLAHLALSGEEDCVSVLDPMAGNGDLLDALSVAAHERGILVSRLDGVEIDERTADYSRRRIGLLCALGKSRAGEIIDGSAFDPSIVGQLQPRGYDLVITNPPYVRYQSQKGEEHGSASIRAGLRAIIRNRTSDGERELWELLAKGYSGLADLSVPSWILSAALTRPGGRLAIVTPATWRSRDYADVVRYLLLRLFKIEFVVTDSQPGWFSDALVRTNLVVARRLHNHEVAVPLTKRTTWDKSRAIEICPSAANSASLVGAAFPHLYPEAEFSKWARAKGHAVDQINDRYSDLREEWGDLKHRLARKSWFRQAEPITTNATLPSASAYLDNSRALISEKLRRFLPTNMTSGRFQTLEESLIKVSQGLRTGCNRFFYVKFLSTNDNGTSLIETSSSFQKTRFEVPTEVLIPVLHRQADMLAFDLGQLPDTRVLNLSGWVLPEDEKIVEGHEAAFLKRHGSRPRRMPEALAAYVRRASQLALDPSLPERRIPDLSAVSTNVRRPSRPSESPSFWYTLPAFAARHLPAMFVPRINHGVPAVCLNGTPRIIIDANFSTLWSANELLTDLGAFALMSSLWCRAGMEAFGTPLGGGALKLEATHIRQLPMPIFSSDDSVTLSRLGERVVGADASALAEIDRLVLMAAFPVLDGSNINGMIQHIEAAIAEARCDRQRNAS